MLISCPACAARYRLDPARTTAGKRISIRCPGCQFVFPLPTSPVDMPPRVRVLLASGDQNLVGQLKDRFGRTRLSHQICADGIQAMRRLGAALPECLLLDVTLTGRYVFEVIEFLRQRPAGDQVRVLLLTSSFRSSAFTAQASDLHGADGSIAGDLLADLPEENLLSTLFGESASRTTELSTGPDFSTSKAPGLNTDQWNHATALAKVIAADLVLRYQDLLDESARTGVLGPELVEGLARGRKLFSARMGAEFDDYYDFFGAALASCLQGHMHRMDDEAV